MIDTETFYNALLDRNMDFFCGVPDSLLKNLCAYITSKSDKEHNIICANEGNAIGLACGYHISTGKYGVVYMQNSGEGNAINPLLSIADPDVYSIPLLLIIGWRGEPGIHDEPQHIKQGKVTLSLLDAMGVKYCILDESWKQQLDVAQKTLETNAPFALIVRKNTFSDYPFEPKITEASLTREEALEIILKHIPSESFLVSTTGKTSREVYELREKLGVSHSHDFLTVGGMGHTSSIALGMALGTEQDVWCIDGDGSFLMHMGAFPVIAQNAPPNFKYILNNNGAHESVGGQPTVGLDIDIAAILKASGFSRVIVAKTADEIENGLQALSTNSKTALIITTKQGSRSNLGRPTTTPKSNKEKMMFELNSIKLN